MQDSNWQLALVTPMPFLGVSASLSQKYPSIQLVHTHSNIPSINTSHLSLETLNVCELIYNASSQIAGTYFPFTSLR